MNVAFIPVRGGSKSIPLKNIKPIGGKPLVYWTVLAACGCRYIDRVFVATDSPRIADTVRSFRELPGVGEVFAKAEVIGRSAASASDTASTESAMLEFAEQYAFANIALVQATSPLLAARDLDRGFERFAEEGTDSVLSVVRQKRFCWEEDGAGGVQPSNYDVFNRPRRQEFDGFLVENGAFYITSRERLLSTGNRLSGRIGAVEMEELSYFEIDEPSDFLIVDAFLRQRQAAETSAGTAGEAGPGSSVRAEERLRSHPWKLLLTDCDGCLTDGGMYYSEKGDELKRFTTRDGVGFSLLRSRGILTGILTGETVELNSRRAGKLKLDILRGGCTDKARDILDICRERGISPEDVIYVGDDLNDIEALQLAGLGCAPADAVRSAREAADYVTRARGGRGVIREIADLVLGAYAEDTECSIQ